MRVNRADGVGILNPTESRPARPARNTNWLLRRASNRHSDPILVGNGSQDETLSEGFEKGET